MSKYIARPSHSEKWGGGNLNKVSQRINVEDKTDLCATPIHAGAGRVDTSSKPDVREDDFERFLAHIEFKVLWKLILTAIEKQDFIFSAGGLAINLE